MVSVLLKMFPPQTNFFDLIQVKHQIGGKWIPTHDFSRQGPPGWRQAHSTHGIL